MKVLVTGATGLLGSRMLKVFPSDWEVTGAYHSRPVPGMVECSLGNSGSVLRAIEEGDCEWVVHCAAIRSPDVCAKDPRQAMEINARGTERVARAAAKAGARLAYVSTDYVFSGEAPPYKEDDAPSPLNAYGHSKLAGERHALAVPGALVVRIPALYSLDPEAPNNVLAALKTSLDEGESVPADDRCVRYYTLAEDVAAAFAFLMGMGQRGLVHVSAGQSSTKLEFLRAAADAMGLDSAPVLSAEPRPRVADRPHDSHLDTGLYASLGGPPLTGYRGAIERLRKA